MKRDAAEDSPRNTDPPGRRRAFVELALSYSLILVVIWTPRPLQRVLFVVAAAFLLAVVSLSFQGWDAMGLRIHRIHRGLWIAAVAAVMACAAIAVAAAMHTLDLPGSAALFVRRYLGYAIWAVFQQVLLQTVFLARLLRLVHSPPKAALAAALLFALAHLPNPVLTPLTFAFGLAACMLFLRYRNLYPLALAHAALGITLAITVPGAVTHNMRVGLGYLTYSQQHALYRSH